MHGTIISGTGKGAYFVKIYTPVFQEALRISPYPGTLNLRLRNVPAFPATRISIQQEGYGRVDCYPVLIHKNYKAFLLRPHKTIHPETVVEFISEKNLRNDLELHDGDVLEWSWS